MERKFGIFVRNVGRDIICTMFINKDTAVTLVERIL